MCVVVGARAQCVGTGFARIATLGDGEGLARGEGCCHNERGRSQRGHSGFGQAASPDLPHG